MPATSDLVSLNAPRTKFAIRAKSTAAPPFSFPHISLLRTRQRGSHTKLHVAHYRILLPAVPFYAKALWEAMRVNRRQEPSLEQSHKYDPGQIFPGLLVDVGASLHEELDACNDF